MPISIQKQLKKKIALEAQMKPEIRRVFSLILRDFKVSVTVRNAPPQVNQYRALFSTLLDNHYRRVQRAFKGATLPDTKQDVEQTEEEKEELWLLAILAWRELNVPLHADLLSMTTQENMREALRIADEQFAADGIPQPTNKEIALVAGGVLKKKFSGRIPSIAMTETQTAAESSKFIEAEIESGLKPRILGGSGVQQTTTKKKWHTMGDKRVRPAHKLAEGQIRPLNEPYVVGGAFLMYPGDSSMGAGIALVANCRCISEILYF